MVIFSFFAKQITFFFLWFSCEANGFFFPCWNKPSIFARQGIDYSFYAKKQKSCETFRKQLGIPCIPCIPCISCISCIPCIFLLVRILDSPNFEKIKFKLETLHPLNLENRKSIFGSLHFCCWNNLQYSSPPKKYVLCTLYPTTPKGSHETYLSTLYPSILYPLIFFSKKKTNKNKGDVVSYPEKIHPVLWKDTPRTPYPEGVPATLYTPKKYTPYPEKIPPLGIPSKRRDTNCLCPFFVPTPFEGTLPISSKEKKLWLLLFSLFCKGQVVSLSLHGIKDTKKGY